MKKIIVKRLIYTDGRGNEKIGGTEYSGELSNENILGSVHERGKTQWIGSSLWLMRNGTPIYKITVVPFTQYQKSWYDLLFDMIRRI